MRRGRAARGDLVVVHALVPSGDAATDAPRIGFVVGRAVGDSVTRHRVQRRLRHVMSGRLGGLPAGCTLVVRAAPAAAGASSAALAADLDRCLARATAARKARS
jgi:ribonuclease P protein component